MKEVIDKIKLSALSPNQYILLYCLANKIEPPKVDNFDYETLEALGHLADGKVTSTLFQLEEEELGFHMKAVNFSRIFPPIVLPTGVHARGKLHPLKVRLKSFIKSYSYDWDLIYRATENYVRRYEENKYLYMQNAPNFILDKNGDSTLALECDTLEYNKVDDDLAI